MNDAPRFRLTEKVIAGAFLVLLGALFILDNLRLIDAGSLWDYWPLLIVAPGVARLLNPTRPGQRVWGAILVGIGGVLILRNLGYLWVPFHRLWPFALVVIGGYLIWQTTTPRAGAAVMSAPAGGDLANRGEGGFDGGRPGLGSVGTYAARGAVAELNEFALCGGGNRLVQTPDFRGGTITVIAGGFDIDLRDAAIARDEVSVEIFVMMGGVVFRVPEGWKVIVNVTPLLGGSDVKARTIPPPDGRVRTLVLNGFILMGGIEVKN